MNKILDTIINQMQHFDELDIPMGKIIISSAYIEDLKKEISFGQGDVGQGDVLLGLPLVSTPIDGIIMVVRSI